MKAATSANPMPRRRRRGIASVNRWTCRRRWGVGSCDARAGSPSAGWPKWGVSGDGGEVGGVPHNRETQIFGVFGSGHLNCN